MQSSLKKDNGISALVFAVGCFFMALAIIFAVGTTLANTTDDSATLSFLLGVLQVETRFEAMSRMLVGASASGAVAILCMALWNYVGGRMAFAWVMLGFALVYVGGAVFFTVAFLL